MKSSLKKLVLVAISLTALTLQAQPSQNPVSQRQAEIRDSLREFEKLKEINFYTSMLLLSEGEELRANSAGMILQTLESTEHNLPVYVDPRIVSWVDRLERTFAAGDFSAFQKQYDRARAEVLSIATDDYWRYRRGFPEDLKLAIEALRYFNSFTLKSIGLSHSLTYLYGPVLGADAGYGTPFQIEQLFSLVKNFTFTLDAQQLTRPTPEMTKVLLSFRRLLAFESDFTRVHLAPLRKGQDARMKDFGVLLGSRLVKQSVALLADAKTHFSLQEKQVASRRGAGSMALFDLGKESVALESTITDLKKALGACDGIL